METNKKSLIVIGNGDYARMMERYLHLSGSGVKAYAVHSAYIEEHNLDGIPVISMKELKKKYDPEEIQLVMGIGYRKMGDIREKVFAECKDLGYSFFNYIHPTAIIEKNVRIGEGNNILEGVILEESVTMGDANILFGGSLIAHGTAMGSFNTLSVKTVIAGCAEIGNHCFVGAAAVIRDRIKIEDYSLIGAGAYASQSTQAYQVIVPMRSTVLEGKKSVDLI